MHIKEDAPVTTTGNGGEPLDSPRLPIKPNSLVKRAQILIKKSKETDKSETSN